MRVDRVWQMKRRIRSKRKCTGLGMSPPGHGQPKFANIKRSTRDKDDRSSISVTLRLGNDRESLLERRGVPLDGLEGLPAKTQV
jgi:hypothetical protein